MFSCDGRSSMQKMAFEFVEQIDINHTHNESAEIQINLVELLLINANEKLILSH